MIGGVLLVLAIYLALNAAFLRVIPIAEMAGDPFVAATAAARVFGPRGDLVLRLLMMVSLVAAVNANLLMTSRVPFAMSRDGLLPAWLLRVTRGTPVTALIASAVIMLVSIASNTFDDLLAIVAFLYVANYTLTFAGLFVSPPRWSRCRGRRTRSPRVPQESRISARRRPAMSRTMRLRIVSALITACAGGTTWLGAQAQETMPPLLFKEQWQQAAPAVGVPTSPRRSQNKYWLASQSAVTNPALEAKFYGPDAGNITVYVHEGRADLWTGLTGSPVAITLRHRDSYIDLRGLARVRAILRTGNLHTLHPVVRLADGSLLAGSRAIDTDGQFLNTDVSFDNLRWYTLEAATLGVKAQAMKVDLSRVDEVGFVDLAPAGGHGSSGWANISSIEVYAKAVPRRVAG